MDLGLIGKVFKLLKESYSPITEMNFQTKIQPQRIYFLSGI